MDHADHVALIRAGVTGAGPRWVELGAGRGAFTLALADLLGEGGDIVAVDRDRHALADLEATLPIRFPGVRLRTIAADFTRPLAIETDSFDGLLMANSLHFVRHKEPVLVEVLRLLRAGGRFVLVEYGAEHGNPWVPWPIAFSSWDRLAAATGLRNSRQIGQVPSRFLGSIYAAVSEKG